MLLTTLTVTTLKQPKAEKEPQISIMQSEYDAILNSIILCMFCLTKDMDFSARYFIIKERMKEED